MVEARVVRDHYPIKNKSKQNKASICFFQLSIGPTAIVRSGIKVVRINLPPVYISCIFLLRTIQWYSISLTINGKVLTMVAYKAPQNVAQPQPQPNFSSFSLSPHSSYTSLLAIHTRPRMFCQKMFSWLYLTSLSFYFNVTFSIRPF